MDTDHIGAIPKLGVFTTAQYTIEEKEVGKNKKRW
jgi:hypothetical protein